MTFIFYQYTRNKKFINKAPYLTTSKTLTTDKVAGDQDLENPVLTISSSDTYAVAGYNYVYIQDWSRYYFVLKRNWLAENVYQIWLQEDYRYTAKALIEAQTGLCRYSGLGDTNLPDSRIQLSPTSTLTSFPIDLKEPAVLEYWYCVKFVSEQPFVGVTTNKCTINIAIMNAAAYSGFTAAYKAKSETARVKIANCIISVNRVRYMDPDNSSLGGSVYQIQFKSPYDETGGSGTSETLIWTTLDGEKCYIITSPDEVWYINPAYFQVSATLGGAVKSFNTSSHFWDLNAQYILRLNELQPLTFSPTALGLTSNFNIYLSVVYEPYGENYVIMYGKFVSGSFVAFGYAPIAQRCQTSVSFITDNTLNMHEEATLANTLALVGGLAGGAFKILGGALTVDPIGIGEGITGIMGANNSYAMREKQQQVSEFSGMGLTGTVGGSIDWTRDGRNTAGWCYVVTQQPVTNYGGWWGKKGIPDGQWRSLLSLASTDYAEIEVDEIDGNVYNYTENELENIKRVLSEGVIFNASP